jgi:CDP-paratose 2-epimerase
MREAIQLCEEMAGKKMNVTYSDTARIGDHIWYISDTRRFQNHYPGWSYTRDLRQTVEEIFASMAQRV